MRPRSSRALVVAAIAGLAFACGVAIGQETLRAHLASYLVPSQQTLLDDQFLRIQIEEMQNSLDSIHELESPSQTGVPSFSVNPKTGRIQALVTVYGEWIDSAQLGEVQKVLTSEGQDVVFRIKFHMPKITDSDVDVFFTKINSGKNEIKNDFAEFKNGTLTINGK
jgi:hypothetical protein